MKNYLLNLDKKTLELVKEIGRQADEKNLSVFLVGGIVRDLILKRKNMDLDFVVQGDAILFARHLAKVFLVPVKAYSDFGTATLDFNQNLRIDFSTSRQEVYFKPGALPKVSPGKLREDLFRRDFTVNAMAISINQVSFGRLIDEFHGLEDIVGKKIRILHDQSFSDDPTRILRAVRFEQRFGFNIEKNTLLLLKRAVRENMLSFVKAPRYFVEFVKMLFEPKPLASLKRLHQLDALEYILFEKKNPDNLKKLKKSLSSFSIIYKRCNSLFKNFLYSRQINLRVISWMALMEPLERRAHKELLQRYPFTREEIKNIRNLDILRPVIASLGKQSLTSSQIYGILSRVDLQTILYLRIKTSRSIVQRRIDQFLQKDSHVQLDVDGDDLKKVGYSKGEGIGKALATIFNNVLDGKIISKQEQLQLAKQLLLD